MDDWYRDLANSGVGATITGRLGLPRPAVLRRYEPGQHCSTVQRRSEHRERADCGRR